MSAEETAHLKRLPIGVKDLESGRGTNPFNPGRRIFKYRPSDLQFTEVRSPTPRTEEFRGRLVLLAGRLGGRVPYAFRLTQRSESACEPPFSSPSYHPGQLNPQIIKP